MDKKFQEAELLMERTLLLDWWDDERMRITNRLTERFVLLEDKISIEIDDVPIRKLLSPAKYEQEVIEPIVVSWLSREYARLTFSGDLSELKINPASPQNNNFVLDTVDLIETGTVGAISIAPLAAIPFVGGVITSSGGFSVLGFSIIAPSLAVSVGPALAVAFGTFALAAGPKLRQKTKSKLATKYKSAIIEKVKLRALGSFQHPEIQSLKGTLLAELDELLEQKLLSLQAHVHDTI